MLHLGVPNWYVGRNLSSRMPLSFEPEHSLPLNLSTLTFEPERSSPLNLSMLSFEPEHSSPLTLSMLTFEPVSILNSPVFVDYHMPV